MLNLNFKKEVISGSAIAASETLKVESNLLSTGDAAEKRRVSALSVGRYLKIEWITTAPICHGSYAKSRNAQS